jgi:hypothetical protein
MTKKDYMLIAKAINTALHSCKYKITGPRTIDNVVSCLIFELRSTNPKFNANKFREACMKDLKN